MQRHPPGQRPPPPINNPGPPPPPPSSSAGTTFSENQLPSVKSGFYTVEQERTMRSKTCRFIEEAGRTLKLPRLTSSTAMVIFQRFYAVHSFADHDRFEVTVACMLLAAKTEESPKKLTTVIQECHRLKSMSARKSGANLGVGVNDDGTLDMNSKEFIRLKERTLLLERVILHTIGFELSIDHPHKFLPEQAKNLIKLNQIEFIKPPANQAKIQEQMMNGLVQKAISFANDSMQTCLCLQYPATKIAAATIYMSGQVNKIRPTNNRTWLDILEDLDIESVASIVKQILELIADRKGVDKGIFSSINADLKSMKNDQSNGGGERSTKRQRNSE